MNTARQAMRSLVASSAAFQVAVGAADETAALERVYDVEVEWPYSRPCALCSPAVSGMTGYGGYSNHDFEVWLEAEIPDGTTTAQAFADFETLVGQVRREVARNSHQAGRLLIRESEVMSPTARTRRQGEGAAGDESEEDVQVPFIQALILFRTGPGRPP